MNDIELIPVASNLIESTRSIGYSFETALADIIDNSISNHANQVEVKFSTSNDSPYVAIIDNGVGMSSSGLEEAMRYGSSSSLDARNKDDLGRFGLGLKMASMSQCRRLTVLTKQNNEISAATWDLDYIYQTGRWLLIRYDKEQIKKIKFYNELTNKSHGTVVIWESLDRISESSIDFEREFNEKLSFADKHLALVFHRYLEQVSNNERFSLFFNNRRVVPINPFLVSNKATQKLEEEVLFINKEHVRVVPYITPYVSKLTVKERQFLNDNKELNLNQGLYIYRNKRLIVWGKWFRLLGDKELQRLTKVQIDISNSIDESWKIDVKKSSAQIPSNIKIPLKQIVVRAVGKSEKVYRYRGRKISNDTFEHIWEKIDDRGKIQYLINREIPFFQAFISNLNEEQCKLFEVLIRSIEDSFPYAAVYYDLAKRDGEYEETTMATEEVYQLTKRSLDLLSKDKNAQISMIKTMKNTEMLQRYPEVIRLIEEEFGIE